MPPRFNEPGNLTPEERAEMANLQMKLTVLGVTGDEKEQVKEELHKLMDLRTAREKADTAGWSEDEVKEMAEAKSKAQSSWKPILLPPPTKSGTVLKVKERLIFPRQKKALPKTTRNGIMNGRPALIISRSRWRL